MTPFEQRLTAAVAEGAVWSPTRVEVLKALWVQGMSASQIAKQLRHVSRNAVIGKVNRLGLSHRAKPATPRPLRAPPLKSKPPHNPLGIKHRQSKPNQAPCVFGKGMRLTPADVRVGSNGARTYTPPPPAPLPTPSARLLVLAETSLRLSLIEITSETCKFATHEIGGEHRFCGHKPQPGTVYCAGHHEIATIKPPTSAKELVRSLRRYAA